MPQGRALGLFALAVLALRRPLTLLVLAPFMGVKRRDAVFFGWFGPVGVAAIYYALHAQEMLHDPRTWTITSATVTVSVLLHGITASQGVFSYGLGASGVGATDDGAQQVSHASS